MFPISKYCSSDSNLKTYQYSIKTSHNKLPCCYLHCHAHKATQRNINYLYGVNI